MKEEDFTSRSPGTLVRNLDGHLAFIPGLLPPAMDWMTALGDVVHDAAFELGRLDGTFAAHDGMDPSYLLRPLLQREATLSSRIEGTETDETQLSLFEVKADVENDVPDIREVSNYLAALEWGVNVVKERGITTTLIRQLHARLMDGVRGGDQTPGQFRDCQVFLGGSGRSIASAKFVPPPKSEVPHLIESLVNFMRNERECPPLVRAALCHYQFETIHPFRDGNGRVGRLLVALQVMKDLDLSVPALHISPYFERNRRPYYDGLLAVSQEGDWSTWTEYFLVGISTQARDVMRRLRALRDLRTTYREQFGTAGGSVLAYRLIDLLFKRPAVDVALVASELKITKPPATKHVARLLEAGILREVTGLQRNRVYVADEIIKVASRD